MIVKLRWWMASLAAAISASLMVAFWAVDAWSGLGVGIAALVGVVAGVVVGAEARDIHLKERLEALSEAEERLRAAAAALHLADPADRLLDDLRRLDGPPPGWTS